MKPILWLVVWITAVLAPTWARGVSAPDPTLYSYHERPGERLPQQLAFRDSDDRTVHLGELAQGRPLILVPAYFHCSSLCGLVRASLRKALAAAKFQPGRDYVLAVMSIDPGETSVQAREAKAADLAAIGSSADDRAEHYLTGSAENITAVTRAVGFQYRFDQPTGQFMHPAGVVFVTPAGIVSNYLLGVGYTPAAVRSALERASAGRIAAVGSPILLLCFHFDPSTGRYSLEILKVVRLAGILTVLTLVGLLILLYRRERVSQ
jgi:protein SCO1/2